MVQSDFKTAIFLWRVNKAECVGVSRFHGQRANLEGANNLPINTPFFRQGMLYSQGRRPIGVGFPFLSTGSSPTDDLPKGVHDPWNVVGCVLSSQGKADQASRDLGWHPERFCHMGWFHCTCRAG